MRTWLLWVPTRREPVLPWLNYPMLCPFGRSVVASWSELDLDAVGALTWSRGMCCGNVTVLPPLCGVILLVGWPVVASDLMGLP